MSSVNGALVVECKLQIYILSFLAQFEAELYYFVHCVTLKYPVQLFYDFVVIMTIISREMIFVI